MKSYTSTYPVLFAWPSSGRRKILLESIKGHAENLRRYGRKVPILLSLDCKLTEIDAEIRHGLENLSKEYPQQLHIADSDSRNRFLESLPRHIDPKAAALALIPPRDAGPHCQGPGCNRNMMLLASAGRLLISSDDDILCTPVSLHTEPKKPEYSSNLFPLPLRFYSDRTAVLSEVKSIDCDIAERHLKYLGHRASEFIGEDNPAAQGKIVLTCAGCYGNSGFGRARTVLALTDDMRHHMLKQGYEHTRYSREVTRIPDRDLIGPSMVFMAGHSGYDAREYLPPFFPFARNEDGFFAMLVRVCNPGSLTAFPSFALFHNPPERKPFTRESLVSFKPNISELLMALTIHCLPDRSITETRDRIVQLGKNYIDVSQIPKRDFVELIHQYWSQGAMGYAEDLESLLETHHKQPALWATDVDETLENIYTMMREPLNIFGPTGCGLKVDEIARHLKNYGNLLTVWPDMLDFARQNAFSERL